MLERVLSVSLSGILFPLQTDFLYSPNVVKERLRAEEEDVDEDGVLASISAVLTPISQPRLSRQQREDLAPGLGDQRTFVSDDTPVRTVFTVERDAKFRGPSHYSSFEELKEDIRERKVHPRASAASGMNRLLEPIRKCSKGTRSGSR